MRRIEGASRAHCSGRKSKLLTLSCGDMTAQSNSAMLLVAAVKRAVPARGWLSRIASSGLACCVQYPRNAPPQLQWRPFSTRPGWCVTRPKPPETVSWGDEGFIGHTMQPMVEEGVGVGVVLHTFCNSHIQPKGVSTAGWWRRCWGLGVCVCHVGTMLRIGGVVFLLAYLLVGWLAGWLAW